VDSYYDDERKYNDFLGKMRKAIKDTKEELC